MSCLGTITYLEEGNLYRIETTPDVVMRLKRIFPRCQQHRVEVLSLRATEEVSFELEWVLKRFPMDVKCPKILRKRALTFKHTQKLAEAVMASPASAAQFKLALPLRDYQCLPTQLYLAQGHLLNGDWIGLGKTATAIASFTDPRTVPALVVVQAHLPQQWEEEVKKFLPDAKTHIIQSMQTYALPPADVYIISYSKLASWVEVLAPRIRSLVFDEVQELRCTDSAKYKAAAVIRQSVRFCLGLSATPIYNYGDETWAVFNIIAPDALGSEEEFRTENCQPHGQRRIVRDPDALGHYLRNAHLMVRRSRKEVGRELPPVTRFVQDIAFDRTAFSRSVGAAEELAKLILNGSFIERGQASREFDRIVRQATGIAKAPFVSDFVQMLLESGEKVLLGAWHHAVWDIYGSRLAQFNPVRFTGHETAAQKLEAKRKFIAGESQVMFLSLRSGAGTNGLQDVCSCAVLGELDWTPKVHDQFIGRIARDGQKSPVQVFLPVASEGSDPVVASILGIKGAQSSGIVDLGEESDSDMGMVEIAPDRIKQLARDFLHRRGVSFVETSAAA
jgi:hypothetical protein